MINNVILVGNISNEIVVKKVGDFEVVNIVLRVQRNFRDMDTNEYKCDFIPVTFWNVYAHNIGEYCQKGDTVGVKGRLVRKVQDVNGTKVYSTDVVGERIIFIHLKSYFNQFKDLEDKSDDSNEDYGEPSLEELKRMANDNRYIHNEEDDYQDEEEEAKKPEAKQTTIKKKEEKKK